MVRHHRSRLIDFQQFGAAAGRIFGWMLCILLALPATAGPVYPVKASSNGRYLVDQNNVPFLIVGDSPHTLVANVDYSDAAFYLADRATNGFNTLWVEALCNTYVQGRPDASLLDGTLPFTNTIPSSTNYDLTTPNETYFEHVDQIIRMAATNGITVMLDPIETGGWLDTMLANGAINCRAYGRYLGNRYKNFPNLMWISGNDYQTWEDPVNDAVVTAVALGIKDEDANHIQTVELDYNVSSSLDDTNWAPIIGLNGAYTYFPTYDEVLHAYNQSTNMPVFMEEANYEFEDAQGPMTTAPILRKQEYWTLLSGGAGQMYGNHYIWPFLTNWQAYLDTPGSRELGYVTALFETRAWYNLLPDTNHTVVTAGYGTYSSIGYVVNNNYATTARTPDGSLVISYTPVLGQLTVNMSQLSGPAVAHWYDPASGTFFPISGSPFSNTGLQTFTPPGNNSDGDGGWALVLETNTFEKYPAAPTKPRLVQQSYATPQTPQAIVAAQFPQPQNQGDANILAIGWFDTNATISAVSDSAGNMYQQAVATYRGNGMSQAIYYAANISGGTNEVTVVFDQDANYVDLRAAEYAALGTTNVLDASQSGSGIGIDASSGTVVISSTNELLVGAGITWDDYTSGGPGFADVLITDPDGDILEDQMAGPLGSYSATAPIESSNGWLMQIVGFRSRQADLAVPLITAIALIKNGFNISFTSVSNQIYSLQSATNLPQAIWLPIVANIPGTGGIIQITVTNGLNQAQSFFRVASQVMSLTAPKITAFTLVNQGLTISFTSVSNQIYSLQSATNLAQAVWVPIVTNIPGTGGIIQVDVTNGLNQAQTFFRVASAI